MFIVISSYTRCQCVCFILGLGTLATRSRVWRLVFCSRVGRALLGAVAAVAAAVNSEHLHLVKQVFCSLFSLLFSLINRTINSLIYHSHLSNAAESGIDYILVWMTETKLESELYCFCFCFVFPFYYYWFFLHLLLSFNISVIGR